MLLSSVFFIFLQVIFNSFNVIFNVGDGPKIKLYREQYLDCHGNIELLSSKLADDIHKIWKYPEPSLMCKKALSNAAVSFGIICQAITANVFGDKKTERKLKSKLRIL